MFPGLNEDLVKTVLENEEDDVEIMHVLTVFKFCDLKEDDLRRYAMQLHLSKNSVVVELLRRRVPGDGKCLFHAVRKALQIIEGDGDKDYGASTDELRTIVFNRQLEDDFKALTMQLLTFENTGTDQSPEHLFAAYMQSMREGRQWAGDVELRILADFLQREIQIWVSFKDYARKTWGKDPEERHVLQVSKNADYVLLSESNCFFPLKPNPEDKEAIEKQRQELAEREPLRLLYSGVHYDCLEEAKK